MRPLACLDDEQREVFTNEHGRPITECNHRIKVEHVSHRLCRYTGEVEVRVSAHLPSSWMNMTFADRKLPAVARMICSFSRRMGTDETSSSSSAAPARLHIATNQRERKSWRG